MGYALPIHQILLDWRLSIIYVLFQQHATLLLKLHNGWFLKHLFYFFLSATQMPLEVRQKFQITCLWIWRKFVNSWTWKEEKLPKASSSTCSDITESRSNNMPSVQQITIIRFPCVRSVIDYECHVTLAQLKVAEDS